MDYAAVSRFLLRRLAALVLVLVIISFVVFALLSLAPGSEIDVLLGTRPRSTVVVDALQREYHLNQPFLQRYGQWLGDAVRLRFGDSVSQGVPVTRLLSQRLAITVPLAGLAWAVTMLSGVAIGIAAALRRQRMLDRTLVGASIVGVSAPVFATGLFLLYLFGVALDWFPVYGTGSGVLGRLYHLALPSVALALTGTAFVVKLTRAAMISALEQDYIVFARARGLSPLRVIVAYALRNALIPIATTAGIVLGGLLSGTVIIEVTFALPGIGSLLVDSVNNKDIPVVQAVSLLVAGLIVVVNLLTDLAYMVIDPRIRVGTRPGVSGG